MGAREPDERPAEQADDEHGGRDQPEVQEPVRPPPHEDLHHDEQHEHAHTGDEHEHERERRRAGLVVVTELAGRVAVKVGGRGKDLVVHRRRRLPQVRGPDREALSVVRTRRLHQPRVLGQTLRDHPHGTVGGRRRLRRAREVGELTARRRHVVEVPAAQPARLLPRAEEDGRRGGVGVGEVAVEVLGGDELGRRLGRDRAGGPAAGFGRGGGDGREHEETDDEERGGAPQTAGRGGQPASPQHPLHAQPRAPGVAPVGATVTLSLPALAGGPAYATAPLPAMC